MTAPIFDVVMKSSANYAFTQKVARRDSDLEYFIGWQLRQVEIGRQVDFVGNFALDTPTIS